jgi:hypothetical protein
VEQSESICHLFVHGNLRIEHRQGLSIWPHKEAVSQTSITNSDCRHIKTHPGNILSEISKSYMFWPSLLDTAWC